MAGSASKRPMLLKRVLAGANAVALVADAPEGPGRDYYSNVRHEMVPFLPPHYSRVLEVGCGEGRFVQLLTRRCEVWGVELDQESAAVAATRMNRVLVGAYDAVAHRLPDASFDLIVCNDVIEHMADADAFVWSIRTKLVRGGYVMASIPNMRHWEVLWQLLIRRDWKYGREGILDRTHLRFFTERSIRRLFEEAGFEIERQAGINGAFDPIRRAVLNGVAFMTLGHARDIQFRQFGVLARLP
jgi:2-polyprenyl-3-methyl-5-hydroxy-6-metoxy-1,4-benzoquinol methylase